MLRALGVSTFLLCVMQASQSWPQPADLKCAIGVADKIVKECSVVGELCKHTFSDQLHATCGALGDTIICAFHKAGDWPTQQALASLPQNYRDNNVYTIAISDGGRGVYLLYEPIDGEVSYFAQCETK